MKALTIFFLVTLTGFAQADSILLRTWLSQACHNCSHFQDDWNHPKYIRFHVNGRTVEARVMRATSSSVDLTEIMVIQSEHPLRKSHYFLTRLDLQNQSERNTRYANNFCRMAFGGDFTNRGDGYIPDFNGSFQITPHAIEANTWFFDSVACEGPEPTLFDRGIRALGISDGERSPGKVYYERPAGSAPHSGGVRH